MRGEKILSLLLACMCLLGSLCVPAAAVHPQEAGDMVIMATNRFNAAVPAYTAVQTGVSMSLEAGELVTIKATYTPFNANVDFSLIAPNGLFHYLSGSSGVFDEAIEVDQRGQYTLAILNRSGVSVTASGYVNY